MCRMWAILARASHEVTRSVYFKIMAREQYKTLEYALCATSGHGKMLLMRIRRMPRLQNPMKDVASCDMLR